MRIDYPDGGYVEVVKSPNDKLYVIVAAQNNDRTKTINSAEISYEDLGYILSDVVNVKPQKQKTTKQNKKQVENQKAEK